MKQITKQERQSIFALYLNQPIAHHNDLIRIDGCTPLDIFGTHSEEFIERYSLFVNTLSHITEQDCIEIQSISSKWHDANPLDLLDVPEWLDEIMTGNCATYADYVSGEQIIEIVDYLRSKSYTLPAFGFTVDDLIAAGVFKINDNI